jgi:hypothetical protein
MDSGLVTEETKKNDIQTCVEKDGCMGAKKYMQETILLKERCKSKRLNVSEYAGLSPLRS